MSSVRMCDRCGRIFSENEEGWTSFTGTRLVRDPQTKRRIPEATQADMCSTCSDVAAQATRPVLEPAPETENPSSEG